MSSEYTDADELLAQTKNLVDQHRNLYISSGGAEGHLIRFDNIGYAGYLPTHLLETVGRKSGERRIVPVIYGCYAGEWVIIGSKGGAEDHPAWYLNLKEQDEVVFQVATQAFRAKWRLAEGDEYAAVWDFMEKLFPNYADYKKAVDRHFPLIMMKPFEPVPVLSL
jgi:deazaflavin-dependent oxidoreductase (nitroreductase family)